MNWNNPKNPPITEDPVLCAFVCPDGIKYTAIGWHNKSTNKWNDRISGGISEEETKCIGWMELPEPPGGN